MALGARVDPHLPRLVALGRRLGRVALAPPPLLAAARLERLEAGVVVVLGVGVELVGLFV